MTRRRSVGIMAVLAGLTLICPAPVNSSLLPDLPDWTHIRFFGGGADFGTDVSQAGDVNGDGFDDAIVAGWAYESHEVENQEGAAWVYAGSADGLSVDAVWMYESNRPGANFGLSADAAGDVNGDGYGDIIIGAPGYKELAWAGPRGAAYVFHGSPDGLSLVPDAMFIPAFGQAQGFGQSVAGAGDINGDGYDDVAVGVGMHDPGDGVKRWVVFVYYGSADGLVDDPDIVVPDENAKMNSIHVAAAGDVNGDGFADIIAGDAYYRNSETQEGAAFVYVGSPDGIDSTPIWDVRSDQPHQAWFAYRVAGAGD